MLFTGRVYKDGKFWIAESEAFDAMTQGSSRSEAIEMLKDWFVTLVDDKEFDLKITAHPSKQQILIEAIGGTASLIAMALVRERTKSGLSLREVAARLNLKSHNAYAQYERGAVEPSISQLEKILRAINPEKVPKLRFG